MCQISKFAKRAKSDLADLARLAILAIAQKSLGHIVRWEHFPTPHHVFELSSGLFD